MQHVKNAAGHKMHQNAKRLSDSIARVIDAAMEEVKIEQPTAKLDSVK